MTDVTKGEHAMSRVWSARDALKFCLEVRVSAGSKKILIVDDEAHIVHVIRYKLHRAGYEVQTAGDGQEAYELAQEWDPDLIVTDYQMPVLSGYEMCVKLHESGVTADTPVVMVTARGHKLSPSELAKTNIRQLMCKPFSARELLAVIGELLLECGDEDPRDQDTHEEASAA